MNIISFLFNEFLYRPIFNVLMFFMTTTAGNLGLSIILLTLVVRFLLMIKVKSPHEMQEQMGSFQTDSQKIQEKYKDDPEKMGKELMALMKKSGGGPLKGCVGMLIQIPVMIGLFGVIKTIASKLSGTDAVASSIGFTESFTEQIYSFLYNFTLPYLTETTASVNQVFLGMDMLVNHNIVLTILAAVLMYANMKMMAAIRPATPSIPGANVPDMAKMMGFMNIFIVIMMGFFVYNVAAGVGMYILTTTVFSIGQLIYQQRALLRAKFLAWRQKGQNVVVDKKAR